MRATERHHPRKDQVRRIHESVVGLAFLGTPFNGSWTTGNKTAAMRVDVARQAAAEEGIQYSAELISYLTRSTVDGSNPLDEMVQRFHEMVADKDYNVSLACFYETRHTKHSASLSRVPRPKRNLQTEVDRDGHGIVCALMGGLFTTMDC